MDWTTFSLGACRTALGLTPLASAALSGHKTTANTAFSRSFSFPKVYVFMHLESAQYVNFSFSFAASWNYYAGINSEFSSMCKWTLGLLT